NGWQGRAHPCRVGAVARELARDHRFRARGKEIRRPARLARPARTGADRDVDDGVASMTDARASWNLDRFARRGGWRRLMLVLLVVATAVLGAVLMTQVVSARGPELLKAVFLPIF